MLKFVIELPEPLDQQLNRPRFGSGKHLNIMMTDDFDEPLDDLAEYTW